MKLFELKSLYEDAGRFLGYQTVEMTDKGYPIRQVNKKGVYTYAPYLGVQTSKYHKEELWPHVCMVTARMSERTDELGALIALLHDAGKKFTIGINASGDYCFYGHEEVSAKIAEELLKNCDLSDEVKRMIVAVIDCHLQLKLLNGRTKTCFMEGFRTCYGEKALWYLQELDAADAGVIDESEIGTSPYLALTSTGHRIAFELVEKYLASYEF